MQHAADTVLARMRRPERQARQRAKIHELRKRIPGLAIRTTVIVGFPGETDAEFGELLEFLDEVQLERVGAFTYSPQEGTRAADMVDDVPEAVKRERLEQVQELQRQVTGERYSALLGQRVPAIIERPGEAGRAVQARTTAQADDIDGVTWVETDAPPGTIVEVELTDVVDDYDFHGTVTRILAPVTATRAVGRSLPVVGLGAAAAFGRPSPT
ncbi:MAG: hypothetical protein JNJ98_15115 [Gemmatimonadetes bacterium]|nr:hypothetical protein [Gemmatimonadota bacterium]